MFIKVGTHYYRDPLFFGEDWCISITDADDFPVILLKSGAKTVKAARARANAIMKAAGISARITYAYKTTATFPPTYDGVHEAWCLMLNLRAEMPESVLSHAVTTSGRTPFLPEGEFCVKVSKPRTRQAARHVDGSR